MRWRCRKKGAGKKENVCARNEGAGKRVQRRWPEKRGRRCESLVAAQRWWKKKRVSRGGGGMSEQLQREKGTTGQSSVAGGETRRRQHNGGSTIWGLAWWCRLKLQRGKEETTTATTQRWQHNSGSTRRRAHGGVTGSCREK
ncbi:hypothetical protein DEO72_LG8g1213 [Vigna unguiculata]|uniref:Uncharacterized protein n=1 Tax=Vigna unguiculata TaxID=3917 RepID=A0A4D6MRD6_VIGUN|nr:hypothetical protein DEO72_LG8g1213 [Vigna unguiculata]